MKQKVILRAPVLTCSGYGVHSRQIFRWLEKNSDKYDTWVNAVPWGSTTWFVDANRLGGLVGRIMDKTGDHPKSFDISIQIQLPNEWDSKMAKFNVGITAAVETDRANPSWITNVNMMDLVIVPSEHAKQSLVNAGGNIQTKIEVVPEAFIDEVVKDDLVAELPDFKTDFNFLVFGQITGNLEETDRKNTYKAIKWICEAFKKNKDVGIVIKTNSARNSQFDRSGTKDLLKNLLDSVRPDGTPPVYFLHGEMTNDEVAALYRHPKIKSLVSLTRGEGYGLPTLEAAASGLPIIATDWSGHLDFLNRGKFLKVDYDLKEVSKHKIDKRKCPACNGGGKVGPMTICSTCGGSGSVQIFMEGSKWAEPKETSAKKVLKRFYEMPEKPQEWAVELATVLKEEYSQEAIEKHYDRVFSEVAVW